MLFFKVSFNYLRDSQFNHEVSRAIVAFGLTKWKTPEDEFSKAECSQIRQISEFIIHAERLHLQDKNSKVYC